MKVNITNQSTLVNFRLLTSDYLLALFHQSIRQGDCDCSVLTFSNNFNCEGFQGAVHVLDQLFYSYRTHMQDLIESTASLHYENYRKYNLVHSDPMNTSSVTSDNQQFCIIDKAF